MDKHIMFEVIPYAKTASSSFQKKVVEQVCDILKGMDKVKMLNIPEVVEENYLGLPYYRNVDTREFGSLLRERCSKDIVINTVAVHYGKERFEQWLDETITEYKINNFVFVGAKVDTLTYPGPSVPEANAIAKSKGVNFGNIFIPPRPNESARLVQKTISGCNFFTSQVLFEKDKVLQVLSDYKEACTKAELKPAAFFLSFAPLSTIEDIAFAKWLGAEISEKTEQRLKKAKDIGKESLKVALDVINNIFSSAEKEKLGISIGLNIEYINFHNLALAEELLHEIVEAKNFTQ